MDIWSSFSLAEQKRQSNWHHFIKLHYIEAFRNIITNCQCLTLFPFGLYKPFWYCVESHSLSDCLFLCGLLYLRTYAEVSSNQLVIYEKKRNAMTLEKGHKTYLFRNFRSPEYSGISEMITSFTVLSRFFLSDSAVQSVYDEWQGAGWDCNSPK